MKGAKEVQSLHLHQQQLEEVGFARITGPNAQEFS